MRQAYAQIRCCRADPAPVGRPLAARLLAAANVAREAV